MRYRHAGLASVLTVSLLILGLLAAPAAAAPAAGEVEFTGGGYGHGVGLSQYGAQGMALEGYSGAQIVTHYFSGASVAQLADTVSPDSFLLTYDEPLWVGLMQNRLTFTFKAIGGDLELCQAGDNEGACPKSVTPHDGETWSFTFDGSQCQFEHNGAQGNPGDCFASISWSEGTMVELPDIGLTVAHGTLKIRPVGSLPTLKFHVSLAINVEDYVKGIDEMPSSWEPAALQAQAIAARTYAVSKAIQREPDPRQGTLADPGLWSYWKDLCWCHVRATSVDQNYDAWDQEQRTSWVAAAQATAGQVLTHPNSNYTEDGVIEAFFSSSTAGVTETNVGGFGSSSQYPYLVSVDDHWSRSTTFNSLAVWSKTVAESSLRSELATTTKAWHADFDSITGMSVLNGPPQSTVRIWGVSGGTPGFVDAPGWWLRSKFGLRSPQVFSLWFDGAKRIWGSDRYQTAAMVSADAFSPGVPVVFIASGENFPDALSTGAAAAKLGGPVLLTRQGALPWSTAYELDRLNPASIVVVGGEAAVSNSVLEQLGSYTSGSVTRVFGADRYGTAVAVSAMAFPGGASTVYLASGSEFADALGAAPAASAADAPILLVRPDSIPAAVMDELVRLDPSSIVVLGGTGAISDDALAQAATVAPVTRLGGVDRYETAALVSAASFSPGVPVAYVALGTDFPDGLGGGAVAGSVGAPLLLTGFDVVPQATLDELQRLQPDLIVILGGPGVVDSSVEVQLQQLLP